MAWQKLFGGSIWFQWARTIVFVLLFAEYVRLVLTTDTASYRIAVMLVLGIVSVASLIALVQAMRQRAEPRDT